MSGRIRIDRRQFLTGAAAAGTGLWLGGSPQMLVRAFAQTTPSLDPATVPKYVTPLVVPPPMPRAGVKRHAGRLVDYYEIAVRQFRQQILPASLPNTLVWGYGSPRHRGSFNYPAFTIEARQGRPVRVKWMNQLVDGRGDYLPHLLPIDPTLHWANPAGGVTGRDMRPTFTSTPPAYTGPVPLVTHVHGAHTHEESDGYPEAWYLPNARNIPAEYARVGSFYDEFAAEAAASYGQSWGPGYSVFQYPNDQAPTTLWYHDHTLGMTRNNVYAGPAGFYLLREPHGTRGLPVLPGPAPVARGRQPVREIPLAIQDRSFNADGSLFYPDSRAFFDGITGPYVPDSDVPPIWNPEFFGNTMVVNGKTWPVLNVQRRRYRFRLLNGCNARFLILKLVTGDPTARPGSAALPLWQIGAEGGFMPQAVQHEQLLMAPAERADCIVDFGQVPEGTVLYLINVGPDEPFGGGVAGTDFPYADPNTTGQVMKIVVGRNPSPDRTTLPEDIAFDVAPLPAETVTRKLSLNEMMSMDFMDSPVAALLGTVDEAGAGVPLMWHEPVTERPNRGTTEVWEFHNFTADAHPIHVHLVQFEVVNREVMGGGPVRGPEPNELGRKDTVIAYPGEITRIKATFDVPGRFVWHCHIVEHEDNEMMRPYRVF